MYVLDLADIDDSMLDLVGGKARSLGLLINAGFDVPDGFCVTTTAYRLITGRAIGGDAKAAARTTPLPAELRSEVSARYRALGRDVAVAVRSSATAEDLPDASFAGQQDTFLNVIGEESLLDALRRCWASLWTERAVSYRETNDIDPRDVALAVVVQRMVDAEVAGVAFTADPVDGNRTHTVIDASPGLGEAVVSGAVNPDHVLADSATGRVLERRVGDKRVAIRSRAGGGTERHELPEAAEPCLTDRQVSELVALGRRVQDFAGAPQDLEWAIDADQRLWLTQARPITTLYPVPQTSKPGLRVFLCMTLAQGLTRPITPLGLSAYRRIGAGVVGLVTGSVIDPEVGPSGLVVAGQRQYVDLTPVLERPTTRRLVLRLVSVMEARTATVLQRLDADGRLPRRSGPVTTLPSLLPTFVRIAWLTRLPARVAAGLISPRLARRGLAGLERRLRRRLEIGADATPAERLDFVEERLGSDTFIQMPRGIGYAVGGFAALALARRLLRGHAAPEEFQAVLRGLPHNVTTEMDLELWALTTRIRSDVAAAAVFSDQSVAELAARFRTGELPGVAQRGLTDFLERYGHRAVAEIDLGVPRWSERPEHLIGAIVNYLQLPTDGLAPDHTFARGAAEGVAAAAELTARAARLGALRGRVVGWALHRARELTGLRESPKFLLVLSFAKLRAQLLQVAAAAVEVGGLADAADVCWLELPEIRRALAGERLDELVERRRAAYDAELRRRHIPRILLSDGSEPEVGLGGDPADGRGLRGSPASAGVVTGVARVVLDPSAARLEPGEILVAPSTDPGWTPLFLTAGALVMEMGGSNSHGAVVAREYGIPAVVGVPLATTRIQTGQVVTVDGGAGTIELEEGQIS